MRKERESKIMEGRLCANSKCSDTSELTSKQCLGGAGVTGVVGL